VQKHGWAYLNAPVGPDEESILLCALAERDADQEDRLRNRLRQGGSVAPGRFWRGAAEQPVSPLVARTLRAPSLASRHLRYHRFRLAYRVMLQPAGRAMRAYWRYLFTSAVPHGRGVVQRLRMTVDRSVGGVGRTAMVLASASADRRSPGQGRRPKAIACIEKCAEAHHGG
jgi:hypothetical protein